MSYFTKKSRLLTARGYKFVFAHATRIYNKHFILFVRANDRNTARLGLAISKRNVAKAYARNHVKRMVRESFRLQTLPPVDIVFVARAGIEKLANNELFSELDDKWQEIENRLRK